MMRFSTSMGASTLCLAACGGKALTPDAAARGTPADGQFQTPVTATSFTASQVNAALASCSAPHGPAVNTSSESQEQQLIVGAWVACPPSPASADGSMFLPGIVFQPVAQTGQTDGGGSSGRWIGLESDPAGGLAAATGVQTQGEWWPQNASDVAVVTEGGDSEARACFAGPVSFETSPRRMYVVSDPTMCPSGGASYGLWLVAL
jgi:hypothetical protein